MMHSLTALENHYQSAKRRLEAAQQEKLEAAAEFLAARAALHQKLEALWPDPCSCGENVKHEPRHTSAAENEAAAIWV